MRIVLPSPRAIISVFWQTTRIGVNFICTALSPSWLLLSSRNLSVMSPFFTVMESGSLARIQMRWPSPSTPAVW